MLKANRPFGLLLLAVGLILVFWLLYPRESQNRFVVYFATCHCPPCERVAAYLTKVVMALGKDRFELRVVDTLTPEGQEEHRRLLAKPKLDYARYGICPAVFRFRGDDKGKSLTLIGEKEIYGYLSVE